VSGQEVLSKEQEKEIKLSEKYYYGEGTDLNEKIARQLAMEDLIQQVAELPEYSTKKEEILLSVETKSKIAQLQMIGRIKIIAWIDIADLYPPVLPEKQTVETEQEVETELEQEEQVIAENPKPEKENPNQPLNEVSENTSPIETRNPHYAKVVQVLSTGKTFSLFYRNAEKLTRQGKLIYGSKKTSFSNHNKCLIAVFSSSGTLIALLDEGSDSRPDLLTGKVIQNPEQYYRDNELFWIQIN
jgi:hypothetical protein